jgi:hypothetical protein
MSSAKESEPEGGRESVGDVGDEVDGDVVVLDVVDEEDCLLVNGGCTVGCDVTNEMRMG